MLACRKVMVLGLLIGAVRVVLTVVESLAARKPGTLPELEEHKKRAACERVARTNIAVLISGQLGRFVWKDQHGPLIDAELECPPPVDVFIVLHNSTARSVYSRPKKKSKARPPYVNSTSANALAAWYRKRGARNVYTMFLNDRDVAHARERLASSETIKRNIEWIQAAGARGRRWHANLNMFYFRHAVFALALRSNVTYDVFTYWREDNYFVKPLSASAVWQIVDKQGQPVVMVDKHCGFGSYSDKIYVCNHAGALVLFDPNWSAFSAKIDSWIERGVNRTSSNKTRGLDPLQSEGFLQHVLDSRKVFMLKEDLKRVDMRYEGQGPCVHHLYEPCSPALRDTDLPTCGRARNNHTKGRRLIR